MPRIETDILIVGCGMAGLSLAAALGRSARIHLIEQESQPGFHATGRSVAFWTESYGGPGVQPLTSASGPLLANPDPSFSSEPFLRPRGAIHIGTAQDDGWARALIADFESSGVEMHELSHARLQKRLSGLRDDWVIGIAEPSCADIDVAALLQANRRAALQGGATLHLDTQLLSAHRQNGAWHVETNRGQFACSVIVNAAGAWADSVARSCGLVPLGIEPLRRTVLQLRCAAAPRDFPLVVDLGGEFYFKPEGTGRIWLSPHDETPDIARDVAPEEIDVATALDRFHKVMDWPVEAVERRWAGLRSFAPDRLPVYGFDPREAGFFWFAGQGGFGIQTAPAAALLAASLLLGNAPDAAVASIDPTAYLPDRLLIPAAGRIRPGGTESQFLER